MKQLFILIVFFSFSNLVLGQEVIKKIRVCEAVHSENVPFAPIDQSSLKILDNTATILCDNSKKEKLKITGTVYEADGVTPAKNTVLYFEQANEDGEYELITKNGVQYLNQSAVIKTDENGQYTLDTFVPGYTRKPLTYPSTSRPKHIHVYVVENGSIAYELPALVFHDDSALSKFCKRRLVKKGQDNLIVTQKENNILIASKDIKLKKRFQLITSL